MMNRKLAGVGRRFISAWADRNGKRMSVRRRQMVQKDLAEINEQAAAGYEKLRPGSYLNNRKTRALKFLKRAYTEKARKAKAPRVTLLKIRAGNTRTRGKN